MATTPISEFSHNSLTPYVGADQKFLDARLLSYLGIRNIYDVQAVLHDVSDVMTALTRMGLTNTTMQVLVMNSTPSVVLYSNGSLITIASGVSEIIAVRLPNGNISILAGSQQLKARESIYVEACSSNPSTNDDSPQSGDFTGLGQGFLQVFKPKPYSAYVKGVFSIGATRCLRINLTQLWGIVGSADPVYVLVPVPDDLQEPAWQSTPDAGGSFVNWSPQLAGLYLWQGHYHMVFKVTVNKAIRMTVPSRWEGPSSYVEACSAVGVEVTHSEGNAPQTPLMNKLGGTTAARCPFAQTAEFDGNLSTSASDKNIGITSMGLIQQSLNVYLSLNIPNDNYIPYYITVFPSLVVG